MNLLKQRYSDLLLTLWTIWEFELCPSDVEDTFLAKM